jgi:DnaJ homolog subfamily C member 9
VFVHVAGSDEEMQDLKKAYLDARGDMGLIIDNVLCATVDDETRFRKIIESWISDKTVKPFAAFTRETEKKREDRKRKVDINLL